MLFASSLLIQGRGDGLLVGAFLAEFRLRVRVSFARMKFADILANYLFALPFFQRHYASPFDAGPTRINSVLMVILLRSIILIAGNFCFSFAM